MKLFKRHKQVYTMDMSKANETLQNVFVACKQEPNTIPFDKIVLKNKAQTRAFTIGRSICLLFIVFLFIIPFLFPHAPFSLKIRETQSRMRVVSHYMDDKQLYITISGGEIDFASCDAYDLEGNPAYLPTDANAKGNTISFPYTGKAMDIYIYDMNGNCLHLFLEPNK